MRAISWAVLLLLCGSALAAEGHIGDEISGGQQTCALDGSTCQQQGAEGTPAGVDAPSAEAGAASSSERQQLISRLFTVEETVATLSARVAQLEELLRQQQGGGGTGSGGGGGEALAKRPRTPGRPLVGLAASWLDNFAPLAAVGVTGNITAVHGVLQSSQSFMPRCAAAAAARPPAQEASSSSSGCRVAAGLLPRRL
jgi:hypothetical protein